MKICTVCDIQYNDSVKFCRKCGKAINDYNSTSPEIMAKRELFEIRLKDKPIDINLLCEFADFLSSVPLYDDALKQLIKASEIEPSNESIRRKLIEIYIARKDWLKAATQLIILIDNNQKDLSLYKDLSSVYISDNKFSEAIKVLKTAHGLDPNNTDILIQIRDLLIKLKDNNNLIAVCRQLIKLSPSDLSSYNILANQLLKTDDGSQALPIFKSILKLDNDNAYANLYVGIDQYNNQNYVESALMLKKASRSSENFSDLEKDLVILYLIAADLKTGVEDTKDMDLGDYYNWEDLDKAHHKVLSEAYYALGDVQLKNGEFRKADHSYSTSLKFNDNIDVRNKLAKMYADKGDGYNKEKNYVYAIEEYRNGLKYSPNNLMLLDKINSAITKKRNRTITRSIISFFILIVILGTVGFIYLSQGIFDIQVTSTAKISILKNDKILFSTPSNEEKDNLKTSFLRWGSYKLIVEKEGYEHTEQNIKIKFGRKTQKIDITLKPSYGSLRIDSVPKGAKVLISNKYENKTCSTPCEFNNLFAMKSRIKLTFQSYNSFEKEIIIPENKVVDLGIITLPLEVNNSPTKHVNDEMTKSNINKTISNVNKNSSETAFIEKIVPAKSCKIQIDSNPKGASVTLDGENVGVTPLDLTNIKGGEHSLVVFMNGLTPYQKTLSLVEGENYDLGLISFVGSIKIASDPSNAEVFVDGGMKGNTPIVVNDLMAKETSIELKTKDQQSWAKKIQIRPNEVTDLGIIKLDNFQGLELTESELKTLIKDYYDNKGEWAGQYVIDYIEKMRVLNVSESIKDIHVRYKYKNQTTSGFDQRIFRINKINGQYSVIKMYGYYSATF